MPVFVAFLRAINLGKERRLQMADLRAALEDAGYDPVTTHLQSGNVVLAHPSRRPQAVTTSMERILRSDFGLDVDVMVRTAARVDQDHARQSVATVAAGAVHLALLRSKPSIAATRALSGTDFGGDELVLRGTEIYLRYAKGVTRGSKMSAGYFERVLGVRATQRTWNVVTKLQALAAAATG